MLCEKEPLPLIDEDFFDGMIKYDDWELDEDIVEAMEVFNKVVENSRCNDVYLQIKIAAILPNETAQQRKVMIKIRNIDK